jgi:hypothetical protein
VTQDITVEAIRGFISESFASEVGLSVAEVVAGDLTLSEVLRRSPKLVNSVDLMECFARTSNAVRKDFGLRVRLPAYPVNTTLGTIMEEFVKQAAGQIQSKREASCNT